ncbi:CidA/LrgA family protein [Clostridium bovifaecis]|uniref:CidA/LrgA family protein n=1 Tax=Clostridium bovifaecis TaxID=2184719 RepID=A0A6I6EJ43_9CLOT|nr:CidA/LrgA family protein [Clostridium bovifaecis]
MKLLRQASIILGIYFLGELLQKSLNLPIPGSVIGMLILLGLLYTGVIKLDMIEEISNFLLDHLAIFFIPAGVGLISSFSLLRGNWFAIIAVSFISTIIVLVATGIIVQIILKGGKS